MLEQWRAAHLGCAVAVHFWAAWCGICQLEQGNVYGGEKSDVYADNISFNVYGIPSYRLTAFDRQPGDIRLGVMGRHNVDNSLAAVAASLKLGISFEDIAGGLSEYTGVGRRPYFSSRFLPFLSFQDCLDYRIHFSTDDLERSLW